MLDSLVISMLYLRVRYSW